MGLNNLIIPRYESAFPGVYTVEIIPTFVDNKFDFIEDLILLKRLESIYVKHISEFLLNRTQNLTENKKRSSDKVLDDKVFDILIGNDDFESAFFRLPELIQKKIRSGDKTFYESLSSFFPKKDEEILSIKYGSLPAEMVKRAKRIGEAKGIEWYEKQFFSESMIKQGLGRIWMVTFSYDKTFPQKECKDFIDTARDQLKQTTLPPDKIAMFMEQISKVLNNVASALPTRTEFNNLNLYGPEIQDVEDYSVGLLNYLHRDFEIKERLEEQVNLRKLFGGNKPQGMN
ncbi:MAG: hypothetical protein KKA62_00625 [Nanoarchaeota archaeon]|nr:hypothetical protein [Nanoarchaeota archaeon]MBU1644349.1 hypothetical protein [Nanoarchaeota archaeon]MBU1976438.1 hypothetical protein [Nanoarchaeota archaeon]